MRLLTPVIEIATVVVFYPRQYFMLSRAVALQLIREDHPRNVLPPIDTREKNFFSAVLLRRLCTRRSST
jgi:hypothetical protein